MLSHAFVSARMIKSPPYTARGKCRTATYRTHHVGAASRPSAALDEPLSSVVGVLAAGDDLDWLPDVWCSPAVTTGV